MSKESWDIAGVSVAGFARPESGTGCQDAHVIAVTDGGWFVGVASDGAGSAARGSDGANLVAQVVVREMMNRLEREHHDIVLQVDSTRLWLEDAIERARTEVAQIADAPGAGKQMRDFHATVVGAVAGQRGGVLFHIGDGAAFAAESCDLTSFVLSLPENGEYLNSTYFFTEEYWRSHLRLRSFDERYDLIALMSDGVTPFALGAGGRSPFAPFFQPLNEFLVQHDRAGREKAITTILQRDAVRRITHDDKTLVWALRHPRPTTPTELSHSVASLDPA